MFFTLVSGVYEVVTIGPISFLMLLDRGRSSGRIAVPVGAPVLSVRAGDALPGSDDEISLVGKVHIAAMAFVLAATLAAVLSRRSWEAGKENLARRRDRAWLLAFGASFALVNGA